MKTLSFIGPRLMKDGPLGYYGDKNHPVQEQVKDLIKEYIKKHAKTHILYTSVSGGIEEWATQEAFKAGMSYVVLVPFDGFADKMPSYARSRYDFCIAKAAHVEYLDRGDFSKEKMDKKDEKLLTADTVYSFYGTAIKPKVIREAITGGKKIVDLLETNAPSNGEYWIEI